MLEVKSSGKNNLVPAVEAAPQKTSHLHNRCATRHRGGEVDSALLRFVLSNVAGCRGTQFFCRNLELIPK